MAKPSRYIGSPPQQCILCPATSRFTPAKFVAWDDCEGMCSDCTNRSARETIEAIKLDLAYLRKLVEAGALVLDDDVLDDAGALAGQAVAA